MFLKKLTIKNLRCIQETKLEFSNNINFLLGENAQGKSTILEAIFLLSTSKSHRTSKDKEMIKLGEDYSYISCQVEREKRNATEIEIIISNNQNKIIKVDGNKKNKISDMLGEINCVIFSSLDIDMIKGEPKARRQFLNLEISQIYPNYANNLTDYKKTLIQRNNLLKEMSLKTNKCYSDEILDAYDHQLAVYGASLIYRRFNYTKEIFKYAAVFFENITNNEKIEFKYISNPNINDLENKTIDEITEIFYNILLSKRETDKQRTITSSGPHRDDIHIFVNDLPVKIYGSAGQQRSCAISIKMAEIDMIKKISGEYPIILLDDIMSELDEYRQKTTLASAWSKCQTFITTTHIKDETIAEGADIYTLLKGDVIKLK